MRLCFPQRGVPFPLRLPQRTVGRHPDPNRYPRKERETRRHAGVASKTRRASRVRLSDSAYAFLVIVFGGHLFALVGFDETTRCLFLVFEVVEFLSVSRRESRPEVQMTMLPSPSHTSPTSGFRGHLQEFEVDPVSYVILN